MVEASLLGAFLTIAGAIFVAELTDKDALFLLALATKTKPQFAFFAGSVAFTISSAIIVGIGSILVSFIPIFWIKTSGGVIMLAYAVWQYWKSSRVEENLGKREEKLAKDWRKSEWSAFLAAVLALVMLDLAGDATEVLTVVFVAQFGIVLLVFSGAVVALIAATGVETIIGNRIGRILSPKKIEYFSIIVFVIIGSVMILTSVLPIS